MRRSQVFSLIVLFLLFGCVDKLSAAVDQDLSIKFLCEYGKTLYQRGDIEGAKQEFNKVLLIAPDNQAALDFLKKFDEDPSIAKPMPGTVSQEYLVSLKEDMDFMINKIAVLEGKNRELTAAIKTQPKPSPKLTDMQYQLSLMEKNFQKKETEVKSLASQLTKLRAESDNLKKENSLIKGLEAQVVNLKTAAEQRQAEYENKLKEVGDVFLVKNQELSRQISDKDKQIAQLQEQINKINNDQVLIVESLNNELKKRDGQLKDSARTIIDLKESVQKSADYETKIKYLESSLFALQVKFDRLKKESEQKINDYQAKSVESGKSSEQLKSDKDKQIAQLQEQINADAKIIAKLNIDPVAQSDHFKNDVLERDLKIIDLEERLANQEALMKEFVSPAAVQDNFQLEAAKLIAGLKDAKDKMQKELQQEINDNEIKLDISNKGIVITILSDSLFDSGSEKIKPESKKMLKKIAGAISFLIKDSQIIIEGHTDKDPIKHSRWRSNWELSSVRAISVLDYFTRKCGLEADRFVVNAYSEFKPVADNNTKEGKGKNRRVEITILPYKIPQG